MISCTGTNFIIRADAGQMVDWFPTYTLGEDMALALALEKAGYCVSPLLCLQHEKHCSFTASQYLESSKIWT